MGLLCLASRCGDLKVMSQEETAVIPCRSVLSCPAQRALSHKACRSSKRALTFAPTAVLRGRRGGGGGGRREREGGWGERERELLLVACLMSQLVYLRDGSAQTILRAATLS